MRSGPAADAAAVSELATGESFSLLDESGGWAWGFSDHDHYVGYLPATALTVPCAPPSHSVSAPAALVFERPDIKSRVVSRLPFGTCIVADRCDEPFVQTSEGFIHLRHLSRCGVHLADPAAVAQLLVGTPYRWGGRSGDGIDCSGLVQRCFGLAGIPCPRDTDLQRLAGTAVALEDVSRGDLIFLPGHVAIAVDTQRVVHANAHWMMVVVEPLADVLIRAGEVTVEVRRLL